MIFLDSSAAFEWILLSPDCSVIRHDEVAIDGMGGDGGEVAGSAAASCTLCAMDDELEEELDGVLALVLVAHGMAADALGYSNGSHDRVAAIWAASCMSSVSPLSSLSSSSLPLVAPSFSLTLFHLSKESDSTLR